ncbi:hypothetical protein [Chryseobacterium gallinarum]|nr:hypothetical protein [Chryseobacterium gallinarum]
MKDQKRLLKDKIHIPKRSFMPEDLQQAKAVKNFKKNTCKGVLDLNVQW